ncbi:MAG: hypothetical protein DSZ30_02055 [Aquificaceae bacterium]|nr:MAG: hypothetical protein DSZ30_02055 [Aquificaceae bacterium]
MKNAGFPATIFCEFCFDLFRDRKACDFRDNLNVLKSFGITVIGISPDSVESHKRFREKHSLNFYKKSARKPLAKG